MNRSLSLLRPIGRQALTPRLRPTVFRTPVLKATPITISKLGFRYASDSSKKEAENIQKGSSSAIDSSKENVHKDLQNATSSATEEIKGAARDFADMIGGSGHYPQTLGMETSSHGHGGSIREDFYSVTKGMMSAVPPSALFFGGAGLLPYIATAGATVGLAREAAIAAEGTDQAALDTALSLLHTVEHVQITYGAVILSFLGAIHWGFEFSQVGGEQGWRRLAIGVVPVLFAWPTTFLTHGVALATQWAGFTGLWFLDQKATSKGWTTAWYSTYRFYLSIVVGFSIIATLAGTSYYGAGAGAVSQTRIQKTQHTTLRESPVARIDRVGKEKNAPGSSGKLEGKVAGDMQVDEREDGEGYLKLRNIAAEEEQEEEERQEAEKAKKEEQQKKAEKQDKKDEGQMDKAPGDMKDSAKDRTGENQNVEGGKEKAGDDKTAGMEDAVEKSKKE